MRSRRYRRAFILAALPCLAPLYPAFAAQTQPRLTIAQVLSAPFPSDLVAAHTGGRLAWVFNDHGARNIWMAEPSSSPGSGLGSGPGPNGAFTARKLTNYTGDDGVDLGELTWDSSGERIFFTRGGSLEGGGPVNPLSLPSGAPSQDVLEVDLKGGAPRVVGPGRGAAASPRGDRVAIVGTGQISIAPTGGGTALPMRDEGSDDTLTWSPDGNRLAFVSRRTGHSLVGVLDIARRHITWMAPSVDSDDVPEWSPDGRRIAFLRQAAGTAKVDFLAHRQGPSWSILVCDPATGAGRAIWTAPAGPGSLFYNTLGARQLFWAAGNRIVFPWERSGFVHLYAVPATGGTPTALTPGGNFEVFNLALTPDRTHVVYSANSPDDTDRRHLWSVDVGGGAPRQLTHGDDITDLPVVASDGHVAALHSTARDPLRPVVLTGTGTQQTTTDLAPGTMASDFPRDALVVPRPVTFKATDGLLVHGQLFLPTRGGGGRHPALLFFHGGPFREMLLGWHPLDAYSYMYGMNQVFANAGFVVLSVNYRASIGYGLDFREPPGFGPGGASEFNDIHGAALYLRGRSDVDPARIGIWGGSYGGIMTALGLARASNLLAAGVDYAGVQDWGAELPLPKYATGSPEETAKRAELAWTSSALSSIAKWRSPVLVAQADDDRNVTFAQSIELVEGLRVHHVPFEQFVLPNEVHDMLRWQSWFSFFTATDEFFHRRLKQPASP